MIGFALLPGVSQAFGGGDFLTELITDAVILVIWLVATAVTFGVEPAGKNDARYGVWAVRLSLPVVLLWLIFVDPLIHAADGVARAEQRRAMDQAFAVKCKAHAFDATRVFQVESVAAPTTLYVDETYPSSIGQQLATCIQSGWSGCRETSLAAIEWLDTNPMSGCTPGPTRTGINPCLSHFHRTEFGPHGGKVTSIERPVSDYRIRVPLRERTADGEIRSSSVSLEAVATGKVLASTEILNSGGAHCPDMAGQVLGMVARSFQGP